MSTVDPAPNPEVFSQDMSSLRILAVANQKGGVGKTTTAINLGTALAAVGKRVLIVDLDPQGNASTGLGIRRANRGGGAYQVIFGALDLADGAIESAVPRLAIVPSSVDLSGAEIELVGLDRREFRLRDALRRKVESPGGSPADGNAGYDYILIDCPPSLGLLTLNALVAADAVLVPLQCEFYALEGLSHLLRTVETGQAVVEPDLEGPGDRPDHVRQAQQSFGPGRKGCPRASRQHGLRHDDPAQCARVGGAVPRPAGPGSMTCIARGPRPISISPARY